MSGKDYKPWVVVGRTHENEQVREAYQTEKAARKAMQRYNAAGGSFYYYNADEDQ